MTDTAELERQIAELRAELAAMLQRLAAVQETTTAILHIVVQALETNAVASRSQISESIINSLPEDDSEANAVTRCLMLRFAETVLTHPNRGLPPPRPKLRPIAGGKEG